tara:strand:- start:273 stop:503 length:231 start_codon:yes stop_codon:yes gene_type:complete
MDISRWNQIMKSFQDLMGYEKGTREVVIMKRLSFGVDKGVEEIDAREEKVFVHLLRKTYREIADAKKSRESDSKKV